MPEITADGLYEHVIKSCPTIVGVSIGRKNDRATWRATFAHEPTRAELAAVRKAIDSYVPREPTAREKLARLGLTREELKELLA